MADAIRRHGRSLAVFLGLLGQLLFLGGLGWHLLGFFARVFGFHNGVD
jgi:hypothetical protein